MEIEPQTTRASERSRLHRQRATGGRGGKHGRRLPFVRETFGVRMHRDIISAIGRIAYKRSTTTSAMIERIAFDIIASERPDIAIEIAKTAPDFFLMDGGAK